MFLVEGNRIFLERMKYQRLSNEMVDKSDSIKILKKFKRITTLWNCLEMCEKSNLCHYVEYHFDSQDCYLYDKKAYFHIIPSNKSTQTDLYKRQIYSHKEAHRILLKNNRIIELENVTDSETCWEECLKEGKCNMVSYKATSRDCILFEEVKTGRVKFVDDSDYNSITYENIDQKEFIYSVNLSDFTIYNRTQISGFFLYLNLESRELCLNECVKRKGVCIAVSFGENRCHLVKKGEYQLRRFNNWTTIYLEKRTPIQTKNNYKVKRSAIF